MVKGTSPAILTVALQVEATWRHGTRRSDFQMSQSLMQSRGSYKVDLLVRLKRTARESSYRGQCQLGSRPPCGKHLYS